MYHYLTAPHKYAQLIYIKKNLDDTVADLTSSFSVCLCIETKSHVWPGTLYAAKDGPLCPILLFHFLCGGIKGICYN